MFTIVSGAIAAGMASLAATWVSLVIARRFNIVDVPGEIKIHQSPTPRFGGLGLASGVVCGCAAFFAMSGEMIRVAAGRAMWAVFGAAVILLVGAADDAWGLKPVQKFSGELVSGLILAGASWPVLGGAVDSTVVRALIVFAAIMFVTLMENGINLLDGMDGMAGGVSLLIALFLATAAGVCGHQQVAAVGLVLAASCLGFLRFNLPPAKTFMGDVGSLFLGYMIAALALSLLPRLFSLPDLVGVFIILLIPLTDTCLAIVRRLSNGAHVFRGDRMHLYDRIHVLTGRKMWLTLAVMWGLTVVTGLLGIWVMVSRASMAWLAVVPAVAGMLYLAARVGSLGFAPGLAQRSRKIGLPG